MATKKKYPDKRPRAARYQAEDIVSYIPLQEAAAELSNHAFRHWVLLHTLQKHKLKRKELFANYLCVNFLSGDLGMNELRLKDYILVTGDTSPRHPRTYKLLKRALLPAKNTFAMVDPRAAIKAGKDAK